MWFMRRGYDATRLVNNCGVFVYAGHNDLVCDCTYKGRVMTCDDNTLIAFLLAGAMAGYVFGFIWASVARKGGK